MPRQRELLAGTNGLLLPRCRREYNEIVGKSAVAALYLLAMVAIVVGVDILFFRHQFLERLIVNIGIVLVFVAFYLRFLRRL